MPIPTNYITCKSVIRKADLPATAALHGNRNESQCFIAGKAYAPQSLEFACFAGARQGDGLYHGELRFLAVKPVGDAPSADLNSLFRLGK